MVLDLKPQRERMIQAIMDRHWQQGILASPKEIEANHERAIAFYESYRPYAEADVDAIIAALGDSSSPAQPKEKA